MSKKNRVGQDTAGVSAPGGSRWVDYVWANVIFLAFLLVLLFVVRASCIAPGDDQTPAIQAVLDQTFWFLGLLMGLGFLLVTLFDAAYEFFASKAEEAVGADENPHT
jgi:hypothetical protein